MYMHGMGSVLGNPTFSPVKSRAPVQRTARSAGQTRHARGEATMALHWSPVNLFVSFVSAGSVLYGSLSPVHLLWVVAFDSQSSCSKELQSVATRLTTVHNQNHPTAAAPAAAPPSCPSRAWSLACRCPTRKVRSVANNSGVESEHPDLIYMYKYIYIYTVDDTHSYDCLLVTLVSLDD